MSTERPTICPVPWAHVVYRKLRSPLLGDACGHFLIALRFIPYGTLFIRAIRGERERWLVVAGFTVFTACAVVGVWVANGVIAWLSPAEIGFLAVILPALTIMLRRLDEDARRLKPLSGRLEGEVRERLGNRDPRGS